MAVATTAVGFLVPFMTGALAVQIRSDLAIDVAAFGLLFGLFFAVSAISSPLVGWVVERVGWQRGIRLSAAGSAVTLVALAVLARDVLTIATLFVVGGVATAMSQPAANLALARAVPPERHGMAYGLKHVAVPLSTMLAGLSVPAFGLTVGWRWAFVGASALAVATLLASPPGEQPVGTAARGDKTGMVRGKPARLLLMLSVAGALGIAAADSLASFIVAYAVEVGVDEGGAGMILSVGSMMGIASRLMLGWLIDRRQHWGPAVIAAMLAGGCCGYFLVASGAGANLLLGVLLAFGAGWGWSGLLTFSVVHAYPHAPAAATGISQGGMFVGAAVGPPLFGLLAERGSFQAAWYAAAAATGCAALLAAYAAFAGFGWRVGPVDEIRGGTDHASP